MDHFEVARHESGLRKDHEYTVQATVARVIELTQGIDAHRVANVTHRNLERLFEGYTPT